MRPLSHLYSNKTNIKKTYAHTKPARLHLNVAGVPVVSPRLVIIVLPFRPARSMQAVQRTLTSCIDGGAKDA